MYTSPIDKKHTYIYINCMYMYMYYVYVFCYFVPSIATLQFGSFDEVFVSID